MITEIEGWTPSIDMVDFVRRFADAGELQHEKPHGEECERCAFESVSVLMLRDWEKEQGR